MPWLCASAPVEDSIQRDFLSYTTIDKSKSLLYTVYRTHKQFRVRSYIDILQTICYYYQYDDPNGHKLFFKEAAMGNVLEVKELSKQYTKVLAADKVSFEIGEGEIFALIGPNGAGKTTTIRMISTLLTPTSGDAVIAGHSVVNEPEKVRESITYLPDEAGAYKNMTGIKYLRFMAGLFFSDIDDINNSVERAKNICGLGDRLEDKIGSYSRGMIRKLLLSRAVMTKPKLAILDEPTSGLDVLNAIEIRKMIKKMAVEEGMSFLLSSHNMLEIEFVSDRVGIISKGHLMVTGTSAELKERYQAANLEEVFERVVKENEIH